MFSSAQFRKNLLRYLVVALVALAVGISIGGSQARAGNVDLIAHLKAFNVTVLGTGRADDPAPLRDGDMIIGSDIEGPVYVAGDLNKSNTIGTRNVAGPSGEGLVVGGSLNGPGWYNINDGSVFIGGAINANGINMNSGGTVQTGVAGLDARSTDLRRGFQALSTAWGTVSTPVGVTSEADRVTIVAPMPGADGDAVGVLDLDRIGNNQNINAYDLSGADTFIINVPGEIVDFDTKTQNIPDALFAKVIWNLYEASEVTIRGGSEFAGSILAPFAAAVTLNNIEGSHVFGSLDLRAQAHLPLFAGDPTIPNGSNAGANDDANAVPGPGALLLFSAGVIGFTVSRQRKG